ncbi:NAD-binding protein [Trametopsis cervina]|nr:NAD-binding protein [Trametopsis cervina]
MSTTRVAFVTGGAQGIGEAIALRLAQDGLDVAILDISGKEVQLEAVAKKITDIGRKALWLTGNVADETSMQGSIAKVVEVLGSLDVMVANAGITGPNFGKPLVETSLNDWRTTFDVNVFGVMLSYKYAAIQMIKQGRGGRIIGACSMAGKQGYANVGPYSASKFAVHGLTHVLSKELKEHSITVNAYAPGAISTPMISSHVDAASDTRSGKGSLNTNIPGLTGTVPVAEPDVISSLVSYLASLEAYFVTGQIVSVDGGVIYE